MRKGQLYTHRCHCRWRTEKYDEHMSTKTIIALVAVIIIVLGGGYFVAKSMNKSTPAPQQQQNTADTASPQVQGQDIKVGDGAEAKPGDTVSVLYVGKLQDGTVFDSSAAHGNQPLTFTLGAQGLIHGFQIGVNGMKVGGERVLAIPPELGYGTQDVKDSEGKVIIPANSTIIFDVQLVAVEPAATTTSEATPTAQ